MYSTYNFGRMLSVGAIHFEDRLCASKKGGIGRGGLVSPSGWHHMAAVLAGCRKALVSTGWAISLPFSTNGHRNCSSAFVGAHNSGSVDSFWSGEAFAS